MPLDGRTRAAAVLGAALMAAPLWVGRYLPLLDLPQHLALATVLLRHDNPAWTLAPYFEAQHGELTPYWTHYLALEWLGRVMPVATAARVVLTLYVFALPWSAIALARALRRPPALGLFAIPLALNANLYYGFIAYCWSVVLLLWGLALVARQMDAPRARRAAGLAVLAVALFFTHVQSFAFLLLGAAILACLDDAPARRGLRAWPLAPATLLVFLPWVYLSTTPQPGADPYFPPLDDPRATYASPLDRLTGLPDAVAGSYQDGTDNWLLAPWVLALGAAARAARREPGGTPGRGETALTIAALFCYFALPVAIQGQWNIAQRFAWLAALIAPCALRRPPPWLPAAMVGLAAATAVNAAWHHARFEAEAAPFEDALAAVPPGVRVLGLTYDPRSQVLERWPYLHFEQYAVVRGGGMAAHSFAANAPLPVRLRTEARVPAPEVWRPDGFRYDAHGRYFDYFLVRDPAGTADPLRLEGEVEEVFRGGAWRVYRRRFEIAPGAVLRAPAPPPGR